MKRIAVMPNDAKDKGLSVTKRLVDFLSDKAEVFMEDIYNGIADGVKYLPSDKICSAADFAVVLGGDGTILRRASECAKRSVPVLGVNLGRIGFMTEIEPSEMETSLESFLNDNYRIEKRMMIKASIVSNGETRVEFHALNDVVVTKTVGANLIRIELSSGGEEVNAYNADGLIIATPTGSTGYSISAGGPVVDPRMRLVVATPICAHMLAVRSAVLSSDKTIKIRIDESVGAPEAVVTADGDVRGSISAADEIIITESGYDFELIKISDQSFYDTLIKKLS